MPHRFTNDPKEVSARMSRIRGKNTKPELALFDILDGQHVDYETHARVEGISVDALVEGRIAVFVDSPFWHLRDDAELSRLSPHWQQRLKTNRRRDARQTKRLRSAGYTVVRLWADEISPASVRRRLAIARSRALAKTNKCGRA